MKDKLGKLFWHTFTIASLALGTFLLIGGILGQTVTLSAGTVAILGFIIIASAIDDL